MIKEDILDRFADEIGDVVDRALDKNEALNISAIDLDPCPYNLNHTSLFIKECGGVYLKWLNKLGGYSYWLFRQTHKRNIKTKSIGDFQTYFLNRKDVSKTFESAGTEVSESWDLVNEIPITNNEIRRELTEIIESPEVYLYTGEKGSTETSWLRVKIEDSNLKMNVNSLIHDDFEITILLPNNNITLW